MKTRVFWVYVLLAALTVVVDLVVFVGYDNTVTSGQYKSSENHNLILAIMCALAFAQANLFALAATAPYSRHRVWFFLFLPIACGLLGCLFSWAFRDFQFIVYLATLLICPSLIVVMVLGPLRFWQSLLRTHAVDRTDWQIRIRHFLAAMPIVAISAIAIKYSDDVFDGVEWGVLAIYVANFSLVAIACGLLLQTGTLRAWRLAAAVLTSLILGWGANQLDSEFSTYGGVRMNAIALAQFVAWLWLPRIARGRAQ